MHKLPNWSLKNLYSSNTDKQITKDKQSAQNLAAAFEKKYRQLKKFTAKNLYESLTDYEQILLLLYQLSTFASLSKSTDNNDHMIARFTQDISEFINGIQTKLLFYELLLIQITEADFKTLTSTPKTKYYSNFLASTRKFKRHTLKESEEVIVTKLSQSGSTAFVRLYNEIASNLEFPLKLDGSKKLLGYGTIIDTMRNHPKRKVRLQAAKSMSKTLSEQGKIFTFIINTLLLNKKISDEIRKYDFTQQATYLSYDIDKNIVDNVAQITEDNYKIVERYYKLKAQVNKMQLSEVDRYSDFLSPEKFEIMPERKYSWAESKAIILDAFNEFSPEFGKIAQKFFDQSWIDAPIKKGKSNGAFCSYSVPGKNPYILVNFAGKFSDVSTLAHELGHGIHAYLSGKQSLLNFHPSTATAEIASIFCESIVFEKLYERLEDPKQKINFLGHRIQDTFATVSRQIAAFRFESDLHEKRREGEISIDEINKLFQKRMQAMFGKGLKLSAGHAFWWMPWQHIYNYNFYTFTYAFGELLTHSLYDTYKNGDKQLFVKNYTNALALGGSKPPQEIVALMGYDINNKAIWQSGFDLIASYIDELEKQTKFALK